MRELKTIGQAILHGYDPEDCFAFEVQDCGFAPRINPGDFVVAHNYMAPNNGDIAVVMLDKNTTLLRRIRLDDAQITLISDNCKDVSFAPIVLTRKEFEQINTFKVIGVMLGNLRAR